MSNNSSSNSSLAVCFAAAAALAVATPAFAQRAEPSHVPSKVAPSAAGSTRQTLHRHPAQEPEQCFIEVERDHDLGYWGTCPEHGGRRVRLD